WLIFATSPKGEAFETFPASPSGEVPSVSEAEGFLFLCNFQICSFIVNNNVFQYRNRILYYLSEAFPFPPCG
ncbi:MAG: hypothetical protein VZR73_13280, partial [Acutalibacteraceae bacterium]|nr:hypothetical protein [Acutalibacteraceae bacterium]